MFVSVADQTKSSSEVTAVEDGALQIQTMDHIIVHTAPSVHTPVHHTFLDTQYHSLSYFEDVGEG